MQGMRGSGALGGADHVCVADSAGLHPQLTKTKSSICTRRTLMPLDKGSVTLIDTVCGNDYDLLLLS